MSRASAVYIVMLLACVAGLWLIVRAGSGLTAPTDLSGVWRVGGEDPAVPRLLGETMHVEQSGRFVRLSFERGLQVDLKLVREARPGDDGDGGLEMQFQGPAWTLTTLGPGGRGPLIFRLGGPEQHTFTATRGPAATDGHGSADAGAGAHAANAADAAAAGHSAVVAAAATPAPVEAAEAAADAP